MSLPSAACASLLVLLLSAACLSSAPAAEAISPAEQQVFAAPHLASLPASTSLRYVFRKVEAGQPDVDDEAVLAIRQEAGRGRVAQVEYLHGERRLDLPEVDQAVSNPVILHFLEADVRNMRQRLGGRENYFRRRIRLALADTAKMQAVDFDYGGRKLKAIEVTVQPYLGDPLQDRFKGWAGKSYSFLLSPEVPVGVYRLRTQVVDPGGSGQTQHEETLTLTSSGDKTGGR